MAHITSINELPSLLSNSEVIVAEEVAKGENLYLIVKGIEAVTMNQNGLVTTVKYKVHSYNNPKPWSPGMGQSRLLKEALATAGGDSFVGVVIELERQDGITFGKDKVSGLRMTRMSGLDKPVTVTHLVKRGRVGKSTVRPLPEAEAEKIKAEERKKYVAKG